MSATDPFIAPNHATFQARPHPRGRQQRAIGMYDSGVGGLTVMHEVIKKAPHENIVYFGDTARLPYGDKSPEIITRYSIESSIFLMEKNVKMVVVACNTVCSYALEKLQKIFNIPIIGTIEPGSQRAVEVTRNKRIAVLGTKATIKSGSYQREILRKMPDATVISIACPLLVPLIEEQFIDHPATALVIKEYLQPLKEQKVDTIVLGCTHYPLLYNLFKKEMGPDVAIVDSASTCADVVARTLAEENLGGTATHTGTHQYFVTDAPESFRKKGETFFGQPLHHVEIAVL